MKRFLFVLWVLFFPYVTVSSVSAYYEVGENGSRQSIVEQIEVSLSKGEIYSTSTNFLFQSLALSDFNGIEVRFFVDGAWGDWISPEVDEPGFGSFSELVFTKPTERFSLRSRFDSTIMVSLFRPFVPTLALAGRVGGVSSSFHITSRAEWGADESLLIRRHIGNGGDAEDESGAGKDPVSICDPLERKFVDEFRVEETVSTTLSGDELLWPQEKSFQVKKIVIHHTAGKMKDITNDGSIDASDYRLAVKNIYLYHTVTRGWGDVGYNFLVDPLGNVYEGRAGGDSVVGGHVLCENTSTVGIAALGNFEDSVVPREEFLGLARIVQYESKKHGIDPRGMSLFRGIVLPNIMGHSDLAQVTMKEIGRGGTACPGENLKGMLNRLRSVVQSGSFEGADLGFIPYKDYDYQLADKVERVVISPLAEKRVTVRLQNIGLEPWTQARMVLQSSNIGVTPEDSVSMKENKVQTGEFAVFELSIASVLRQGTFRVPYKLEVNKKLVEGVMVLPVTVEKPVYSYSVAASSGFDGPFLTGDEKQVSVTLVNAGNFPWKAKGPFAVALSSVRMRGALAMVDRNSPTYSLPKDVGIGEKVTVSWTQKFPSRPGVFRLNYVPVVDSNKGFKGDQIGGQFSVEAPRLSASVVSDSGSKVLSIGEELFLDVKLQNSSNFVWKQGKTLIKVAGIENDIGLDSDVPIGASTSVTVQVRVPYSGFNYDLTGVVSVSNYRVSSAEWVKHFRLRGRAMLRAVLIAQAATVLDASESKQQVWIDYKNTGNVPWYKDGASALQLLVHDIPELADSSWKNRKIVGGMEQKVVKPGEIARFVFTVRVPFRLIRPVEDVFVPSIGGKRLAGINQAKITVHRIRKEVLRPVVPVVSESSSDRDVPSSESHSEVSQEVVSPVRVLISSFDQDAAVVFSPGMMRVWDSRTGAVTEVAGGKTVLVDAGELGGGVVRVRAVGAEYLEFGNWDRIPAWSKNGGINDNRFRGVLEFRGREAAEDAKLQKSLMLINELSLEDYMKGISEEPEDDSVSQEKRKVIAVLSRSYALHYISSGFQKFPGKPYNASDDPAVFQKFTGYSWEQRSPNWQEALRQTAGEVVLVSSNPTPPSPLQGGPKALRGLDSKGEREVLRAAYFSCSDGRTKTPAEAKFDMKYFSSVADVYQSVSDPLGVDPVRLSRGQCGHGVGLSGLGATKMAEQGRLYVDIIKYYYQGVEVGKIEK